MLEGFEYFIDLCDDAEVNCREILQSKKNFITKRTRLTPSCVLESGFVSPEDPGEGQGYDLGQTWKPKEISRDHSFWWHKIWRYRAINTWNLLFGIPQKLKRNEQYEKTNSLGDGDSDVL